MYNKIRFANELGLLNWSKSGDYIALSRLGEQYVSAKDKYLDDTLSEDQAKLLKNYVMQNPYDSCINLGIASMVECVFTLAKTSYPVPLEQHHALRHQERELCPDAPTKHNALRDYIDSHDMMDGGVIVEDTATGNWLYSTGHIANTSDHSQWQAWLP